MANEISKFVLKRTVKSKIPDSFTIQKYLEGKLDTELAHQLEKQALDDPFLWEALEGYSVYRDPAADLSILQRQLHERIVHLQENKKVFDLSWQRLSVAAAAAVMFVTAGILFWMNSQKSPQQLASQSQKPVEVSVIDRDSVELVIRTKNNSVNAPKSGWLPYREYLDQNTKKFVPTLRLSGSVLVSFKVGSDGKLSDIKVFKGLSQTYDREAMRIIRNGPDWTPPADGKPYETQFEVIFR